MGDSGGEGCRLLFGYVCTNLNDDRPKHDDVGLIRPHPVSLDAEEDAERTHVAPRSAVMEWLGRSEPNPMRSPTPGDLAHAPPIRICECFFRDIALSLIPFSRKGMARHNSRHGHDDTFD